MRTEGLSAHTVQGLGWTSSSPAGLRGLSVAPVGSRLLAAHTCHEAVKDGGDLNPGGLSEIVRSRILGLFWRLNP